MTALRLLTDPLEAGRFVGGGLTLTDEQAVAVGAPLDPLVVIAGAGTGKTSLMAARVVWLVGSGQVAADAVLGLTFTNKAAAELRRRVAQALELLVLWQNGADDPRAAQAAGGIPDDEGAGPTISTYHAYAARLLQEQGLRIGIEPDARLLDDALRFQLAMRVVRRATGPFRSFEVRPARLASELLALESELHEHLLTTAAVREHDRGVIAAIDAVAAAGGRVTADPARARTTAAARLDLLDLVDALRAEKRRAGVIDFGDQLGAAAELVAAFPDVGRGERERFGVVLLDEYQDTSVAQKQLLLDLFGDGHPVTAVGDPLQAIYGWRGASVRNILDFTREFRRRDGAPAARLGLTRNNRSVAPVLEAANAVSASLRAGDATIDPLRGPEVTDVDSTGAAPRATPSTAPALSCALHLTARDEVEAGADLIADRIAGALQPRDVAVLVRAGASIGSWHEALLRRGIPVEVVGLGGLLAVPEVADVVATLEVLDDAAANPALLRLLVGGRWRIGPADLLALRRRAQQLLDPSGDARGAGRQGAGDSDGAGDDLLERALLHAVDSADPVETVALLDAVVDPGDATLSAAARERLQRLAEELADLRGYVGGRPGELVAEVIARSGLDVEVAVRDGAIARSEALASFQELADGFEDLDGHSGLRAFLSFLAVARDETRGLDTSSPSPADAVKLLTVHRSKGLEFPLVVIPDVTKGVFPNGRTRPSWTRSMGTLPFPLRGDGADFPTMHDWKGNKPHAAFLEELGVLGDDEDRRLMYVALTRAQHEVVVSGAWWGPTQSKPRGPSPFLLEVRQVCDAGHGAVATWVDEPGEANPALAEDVEHTWPLEPDPDGMAARQAAAELVRRAVPRSFDPAAQRSSDAVTSARIRRWDREAAQLVAELERRCAPVREVPLPDSLTASDLVRIADDPDRFAADLLRPMPRRPARSAARGTDFHRWVEERFGQRALLEPEELGGAADDLVVDDTELRALQDAFERGRFADRAPYAVEAPFQVLLGGRLVRGRIDAVYRLDDGSWWLVDWKTGRIDADPVQLAVYREAWARLHDVDVDRIEAGFYYVRDDRWDVPDLSEWTADALAAILAPGGTDPAADQPDLAADGPAFSR